MTSQLRASTSHHEHVTRGVAASRQRLAHMLPPVHLSQGGRARPNAPKVRSHPESAGPDEP